MIVVVLGVLAITAWPLTQLWENTITPWSPTGDQEQIALGAQLYLINCAACHGHGLKGEADWQTRDAEGFLPAPPHDETGHTWHHTDDLLFDLTKFGIAKFSGSDNYKTRMPAYEGILLDTEIRAILTYIKSQWPEDIRKRHHEMNQQSRN